jgi:hypothetical protein
MYENFVLDVEWMHLKPKGNAGVFIWSDALPARGQPFLRAVEVQVLDGRETANYTSHGDIFPIHGAKMTPDQPHPGGWDRSLPSEKRAKPAGQWNHYRITADRGRITLEVNGKAVSGGHDITPRKGYIALEAEGSPALFRNLTIRELPSAGELPPGETAHTDQQFRSLYTGVDLSGWQATGTAGHFRSADWQLAAAGAERASLTSARPLVVDGLFVDWRCGPPDENEQSAPPDVTADGAFTLRAAGIADPRLTFSCRDRSPYQREGNQWNRTHVWVREGALVVELNGRDLAGPRRDVPPTAAPIAIEHQGGVVTFANIFVREGH